MLHLFYNGFHSELTDKAIWNVCFCLNIQINQKAFLQDIVSGQKEMWQLNYKPLTDISSKMLIQEELQCCNQCCFNINILYSFFILLFLFNMLRTLTSTF